MKRIYFDIPEVADLLTLATATIQKLVREDAFPKPRQLSGRRVGWLLREVERLGRAAAHLRYAPASQHFPIEGKWNLLKACYFRNLVALFLN